nr:aldehyde dehydrogenase family protein [Rhodococcus wratislaviensis]GLK36427.1 aldehyde dehydrogenase [Rhodococcus wratislaviensis]
MSDYPMIIDGKPVTSTEWITVENPASGAPYAQAPACTSDQLDAAMQSAARAQISWAADPAHRRHALQECAAVLSKNLEQIAALLTIEQGKPIAESRREIGAAAAWFTYYSALDQPVQVVQDDAAARIEVHHKPLGVIAAITPWNYPILLASWKLAPALRAGNSVVLKPSPLTPLTSLLIGRLLTEVLPAGVLNVISGPNELGPLVTAHPTPRKISFTGSTRTGKQVAETAATSLKRVTLELGGNDAAIVLDDIDPGAIAEKLFWSAFINNGQTCIAIKRLFVPQSGYDKYVEALAAIADTVVVGAGTDPATQLGPLNNPAQRDRVTALVDEAVRSGARIATDSSAFDSPGYFHRPTILADVPDSARVVAEEQFGPALPILGYDSVDEAIARANSTEFGLAGSVWGSDTVRAQKVADRLECGTAWVNTHAAPSPRAPFTGVKDSGLGVENGPWGLDSYTQLQTQYIART